MADGRGQRAGPWPLQPSGHWEWQADPPAARGCDGALVEVGAAGQGTSAIGYGVFEGLYWVASFFICAFFHSSFIHSTNKHKTDLIIKIL